MVTAVVANSDSVRTYRDLIGGEPRRRFERRRRYEPACSGVVLYLGLDHSYEHLAHHNFVFSHDPEEEFDAIYRQGEPAADPTCYLAAPARTEPEVAPAGGEALYVLVHALICDRTTIGNNYSPRTAVRSLTSSHVGPDSQTWSDAFGSSAG